MSVCACVIVYACMYNACVCIYIYTYIVLPTYISEQITFGEAGAKIIRANMRNGKLDATVPGKFVQAFFGFCDIRNFSDCTETLQQEVVHCDQELQRELSSPCLSGSLCEYHMITRVTC